jgi:hypothetical protein
LTGTCTPLAQNDNHNALTCTDGLVRLGSIPSVASPCVIRAVRVVRSDQHIHRLIVRDVLFSSAGHLHIFCTHLHKTCTRMPPAGFFLMASQPPRCPVASISQSIKPVQAGSVSITVNRSGSSQKEMTKDGVGGKAFRAKRRCQSFGQVRLGCGRRGACGIRVGKAVIRRVRAWFVGT